MVAASRFTGPEPSIRRFVPSAAPGGTLGPHRSLLIRSVGRPVALCADDPEESKFRHYLISTSFRSPWQNGVAERWVGNSRRKSVLAANQSNSALHPRSFCHRRQRIGAGSCSPGDRALRLHRRRQAASLWHLHDYPGSLEASGLIMIENNAKHILIVYSRRMRRRLIFCLLWKASTDP